MRKIVYVIILLILLVAYMIGSQIITTIKTEAEADALLYEQILDGEIPASALDEDSIFNEIEE